MKCPDCDTELTKTAVVGMDDSYRCSKCGGVWVVAWVINEIAGEPQKELGVRRLELGEEKREEKTNPKCPSDGSNLERNSDDSLPPEIPLWKCGKCKWWWLPGNSVFDLLDAYRIKAEYNRRWRKTKQATAFAMPVIMTLLMVVGLVAVVTVIRNQQQFQVAASSPLAGKIGVIYLGERKAELRFKTKGDLQTTLIKRENDNEWSSAYVVPQGDWKVILVDNVNPGEKLWVSLDQNVYMLYVGNRQ